MTRRRIITFGLTVLTVGVLAGGPGAAQRATATHVVRIAAASDLRFVLGEVTERLRERQPDLDLRITYGSSGTFYSQLVNKAPFDIFMSADVDYPRQLSARGLTVDGSEFIYGVGHLVVWVPSTSLFDVEQSGMVLALDPKVEHIAIANPATAPYGRAAEAAMKSLGVYSRTTSKLVLGETVAQAFQFAQSGSAEMAIIARSLIMSPTLDDPGRFWLVPQSAYPRMEQAGVILRTAGDLEAARRVRAFLLTDVARGIFSRYGFTPAN